MGRKFPSTMHGLILVDKPLGYSSMGAVKKVRYMAGGCKTGHAGTLDPLATGLLICALGKATKQINSLMIMTKVYETEIDLSAFTITDDAEAEREVVEIETPPTLSQIEKIIEENFIGEIKQRPPNFSAVKLNGQPAYKLARKGIKVEIKEKLIKIDEIKIVNYEFPKLSVKIICGKGTYIRSFARNLGEKLGTGGYLTKLRRTKIGDYSVEDAYTLENLPNPTIQESLTLLDGIDIG